MKIDRDAYPFLLFFAAVSAASGFAYAAARWHWLAWICCIFGLLGLYTLYFFRDPERVVPEGEHTAVSAADGVVVDVSKLENGRIPEGRFLRIAVFMNVFDVHVNRAPLGGTVSETGHRPGKKLSAYNKRAEYENEYGDTMIDTTLGRVIVRQIAGLVARRVVGRAAVGDVLGKGERLGLIRFGSRVDVFLPEAFSPQVGVGDRVRAGETIIARYEGI